MDLERRNTPWSIDNRVELWTEALSGSFHSSLQYNYLVNDLKYDDILDDRARGRRKSEEEGDEEGEDDDEAEEILEKKGKSGNAVVADVSVDA